MKTFMFGRSSLGQPIVAHRFEKRGPEVLILGGVHGDEYEGVVAADGVLSALLEVNPYALNLTIVSRFNPDGVLFRTRGNGRGVDLNRNLETKDWSPEIKTERYHPGPSAGSEPENQALMHYLKEHRPSFVLSLHSWKPVLNVNGDCRDEAEVIAKWTGYPIDNDIGYPTPGCLGTYAGLERDCPTLTYEIERGLAIPEILRVHVPAVLESLHATERKHR